jgi:hypothetical protein
MKRIPSIAILCLAVAGGVSALAQETNSTPTLDWNYFEAVAKKNIFDPTRSGLSGRPRQIRRDPVTRYFTFHGTIDDAAFFKGEGTPECGYVKTGNLINGFKVMKVDLDFVRLAEPNGSLVTLNVDDSMKREDEGPWTKSDQPAPLVITPKPAAAGDDDAAVGAPSEPSAGPANESEILKRLRLKREQEDK